MYLRGLEVTCYSRRLPPYLNSDLITELGARYISSQQLTLTEASEMHGPFDLIFEASGFMSRLRTKCRDIPCTACMAPL